MFNVQAHLFRFDAAISSFLIHNSLYGYRFDDVFIGNQYLISLLLRGKLPGFAAQEVKNIAFPIDFQRVHFVGHGAREGAI